MEYENEYRLLYLERLLMESDEEHPLTNYGMMDTLKTEHGIDSHRTTLPNYIRLLNELGMNIVVEDDKKPKLYYLSQEGRPFETAQLKLLIDAVESSKFITKKDSKKIVENLIKLAPPSQRASLNRNIVVDNRLKRENSGLIYKVDFINTQINEKKKIRFHYTSLDMRKKPVLRHNGEWYTFSPYALVWHDGFYYAVGYCDRHEKISTYRVDRISDFDYTYEEDALPKPKKFNIEKYVNSMFDMYSGQEQEVELLCKDYMMNNIVDRFGSTVKTVTHEDNTFSAFVTIATTHIFYRWIFGSAGDIKIVSPEPVKNEYREMVQRELDSL